MKKYIVLILLTFTIGCATSNTGNSNVHKKSIKDKKKRVLTIDLDKKVKKEILRGNKKAISIFIDKEDNDEVAFKGEILKKAKKIKIGDNDEVAFNGKEFKIKTSELKDGDLIIFKYEENIEIQLKIRTW